MTNINIITDAIVNLIIAFLAFLLILELISRLFIKRTENKPSLEESKDDLISHDVKGNRSIITIFEPANGGSYELKYVISKQSINHLEAKNSVTYIWLNENAIRFIVVQVPLSDFIEKTKLSSEDFS